MEENNKLIVKNFIEKITNTGNVENIADYISPDYTEVFNGKRYPTGIDGAKEHIIGVRRTYSDLKLEIEKQIAEGDWVVTCYNMTGVHTGEWMGIKPTSKKITVTGVNVNKVINGKIVEHGGAANMLEAFLEIGVVKIVDKNNS